MAYNKSSTGSTCSSGSGLVFYSHFQNHYTPIIYNWEKQHTSLLDGVVVGDVHCGIREGEEVCSIVCYCKCVSRDVFSPLLNVSVAAAPCFLPLSGSVVCFSAGHQDTGEIGLSSFVKLPHRFDSSGPQRVAPNIITYF